MLSVKSYRSLSFEELRKAVLSLLHDFSEESRKRILLALEVCEDLDPQDKRFRLEQTLNLCLWDFDEAVSLGFEKWKADVLVLRSQAIKYHEENKDECDGNCEVCKIAFRWKS